MIPTIFIILNLRLYFLYHHDHDDDDNITTINYIFNYGFTKLKYHSITFQVEFM